MLPELGPNSFKKEMSEQASKKGRIEVLYILGSDEKHAILTIAQAGPKPVIARCVAFGNIDQKTAREAIFQDLKPRTNPRILPVPGDHVSLEQVITLIPAFISKFFPKVKREEIRVYCQTDNGRQRRAAVIPRSRDRLLRVA